MTAMRYDPARPVDAEEWSQLDEGDQIELVVEHHRRARIRLPNLRLHAGLHVTVENQVLLGEETRVAAIPAAVAAADKQSARFGSRGEDFALAKRLK
jgi:hypothetical protein